LIAFLVEKFGGVMQAPGEMFHVLNCTFDISRVPAGVISRRLINWERKINPKQQNILSVWRIGRPKVNAGNYRIL
jgi:hypothetical protein